MLEGTGEDDNLTNKIPKNSNSKNCCFCIFLIENKILTKKYLFLKCQKILKNWLRYSKKIFKNHI